MRNAERARTNRRASAAAAALVGLSMLALAAPAAAWRIDPTASPADLAAFHRHFATGVYAYPGHPAGALGLAGFDLFAEVSYGPRFDQPGYAATVLDGDLPAGALSVARVGLRKGLPGRLDVGASYGKVLGSDLHLLAGEVSWAVNDGGLVVPTLAFRLTGARSSGSDVYRLDQLGVEAEVSKGFAVLTPYGGVGVVRSRGRFANAGSRVLATNDTRPVLYAGATLHLLLPRITFEVERGEDLQAAVRVGVGF